MPFTPVAQRVPPLHCMHARCSVIRNTVTTSYSCADVCALLPATWKPELGAKAYFIDRHTLELAAVIPIPAMSMFHFIN
eukprot:17423-Heterococcus_DN1.PRE.2